MKRQNEKRNNLIYTLKEIVGYLGRDMLICAIVVSLLYLLYPSQLTLSWNNGYVRTICLIFGIALIFHELKVGHRSYRSYNDFIALFDLELNNDKESSLITCIHLIRNNQKRLSVCKEKIDILKSMSPIPLVVLLAGYFIDKNEANSLLWNYYTVGVLFALIFFPVLLYTEFEKYKQISDQIEDLQNTKDNIEREISKS